MGVVWGGGGGGDGWLILSLQAGVSQPVMQGQFPLGRKWHSM